MRLTKEKADPSAPRPGAQKACAGKSRVAPVGMTNFCEARNGTVETVP